MRAAARRMADAMRAGASRESKRRGTGRRRGVVLSTDPLRVDVLGADEELTATDITMGRGVTGEQELQVDDVLVLIEVEEDEWVVVALEEDDA